MSEWWTYTLSDFLLFSPRTYYRMIERHNEAVWPGQLAALALGIVILVLLYRPWRERWRIISGIVTVLWAFVAGAFLWKRYATINWAATYFALMFAIEAVLLVRSGFRSTRDVVGTLGVGLFVSSLALYPLLAPLLGRGWRQAEVFGVAPDPTVLGTLGLFLVAQRPTPWWTLAVPLLWCLVSGATLWVMGSPEAWVLPLAAIVVLVARHIRRSHGTGALVVLLSTVFCGTGSAQQVACVSKRAGSIPAVYAATVARERTLVCERLATQIPGVQVAVAVNGTLVWSEGFGYADAERRRPVTRETQFRIGSVSKPLTATAVGLLYEQGKLDLDAPVQRYVPWFPDKGYPITTRQLAGHLAGIRHYRDREFFLNRHFATVRDGLTIFQDDSLLFPPGTRFSYSSYAWNLVSAVVEGASGEDFLRYMAAHVFRPLGLTHTAPDRADSLIPGRTQFYDRDTVGGYRVAPAVDNSYKWAGGGFVSTAEDLVKFGSALLEPGFLKRETLELLFTSQHTSGGEETGYGIGWFVRTDSLGHRWAFHGGGSVGGTTAFGLDRDSHVVVAILTNLTDAPLDRAREIQAAFDR